VLWLDRVVVMLLCKELCSGVLERRILSTTSFLSISAINNTITVSIPPLPSFFLSLYYLLVAVCISGPTCPVDAPEEEDRQETDRR